MSAAPARPDLFDPIEARLRRADEIGDELAQSLAAWTSTATLRQHAEYLDERRTYRSVFDSFDPPPDAVRWGLLVGDFVHNLRSALDNVVFALARLKRDSPLDPAALHFPVCTRKKDWNGERVSKVTSQINPTAADHLLALQPFRHTAPPRNAGQPETHPLVALHQANVDDKHRVPSLVVVVPHSVTLNKITIRYEDPGAARRNPMPSHQFLTGVVLTPGAALLEVHAEEPIAKVGTDFDSLFAVALDTRSGPLACGDLLGQLASYVWEVVASFRPWFGPT